MARGRVHCRCCGFGIDPAAARHHVRPAAPCLHAVAQTVPDHLAATAQAIYRTVGVGAATALITVVSGLLYARMGAWAFGFMSILCLAALPIARLLSTAGDTAFARK